MLHRLEETQPEHLYGPKWTLLETSFENNYFHANIQNSKSEEDLLQILAKFSVQNLRVRPPGPQINTAAWVFCVSWCVDLSSG